MRFLGCLILGLFVFGCADPGGFDSSGDTTSNPGTEPTGTNRISLYLFSAGWCPSCKKEIPEIHSFINTQLGQKKDRIDVVLYVGEQDFSGIPANQSYADKYVKALGVDFKTIADPFFRKHYRPLFGNQITLLSAAILDEDANELYKKQGANLSPQRLVDYMDTVLK